MELPTYSDVVEAEERIRGVAHKTPIMTSHTANRITGAELYFKCENFQRTGTFKFRGAYNSVAQFSESQRKEGVLTYSSGNHGQAIALSGKLLRVKATILMPNDAPTAKVVATKGYGAEVLRYDRYNENPEEISRRLSQERRMTLISPFDHPHVMAGQGTAGKELIEEVGRLDYLFVSLGGGGLLSGSVLSAKALNPRCRVIGVEPEAGNDGQQSFKKGEIVTIDVPKTIADGATDRHLGQYTFPVIKKYVDDILTVTDQQLIEMMKFFAQRMKMVVEPTGCLAAAAAMSRALPVEGKRIGVIISGGNVDIDLFARLLQ